MAQLPPPERELPLTRIGVYIEAVQERLALHDAVVSDLLGAIAKTAPPEVAADLQGAVGWMRDDRQRFAVDLCGRRIRQTLPDDAYHRVGRAAVAVKVYRADKAQLD